MKHNKKRNTAFLYECLIKELTKSVVRKETKRKNQITNILKEYFTKGTILRKELDIYKTVFESKKMSKEFAQRFLFESKKDFNGLNKKEVFNTQTSLINKINKNLKGNPYANFVPNYKNIASLNMFFNSDTMNAKNRLIVETKLVGLLSTKVSYEKEEMKHIDNLTYKTFVDKFNETYSKSLRKEQKDLLTNYIVSFSDNGLGLKAFLNEEIGRLKKEVGECINNEKIAKNEVFLSDTRRVLEKLESFAKTPITEQMVREIFYIQDLVLEVKG